MIHVALLRGVNVGGNRKVEMKRLKTVCEALGLTDVRTYINSGNVVFRSGSTPPAPLVATLEAAILEEFGFPVKVIVRDAQTICSLVHELPATWVNDSTMKCDVMFLDDEVDDPGILDRLIIKPVIDDVKYADGAVLWRVDRPNVTRSGMLKLIGTELYSHMTVRNCNTVRKVHVIMQSLEPSDA
ncbi:MAG: DUF1697 domain-containing protein [Coriobacteriia bacterium]|nr:DUF1697 domain-containing protein [Coriobacteriia bacterium]